MQLLRGARQPVEALAFAPDGTHLAAGGSYGGVWRWDPATGASRGRLAHTSDVCTRLVFSPDGRRLAGVVAARLVVWDVATGRELAAFAGGPRRFTAVAFSPGGRLFAACDDV